MAYEAPITIAKALENIQSTDYVLPAIQREFVWKPNQITALFDSLMRGYPIGTFLFWIVDEDRFGDFKSYEFLDHYHERDRRYNPPTTIVNKKGVIAILDGQQRLTALNIGLRGSYAWKIKYGRWADDLSFPKRKLYLNLLSPAEMRTDIELKYDFRFLTDNRAENPQSGEHWLLVSEVLNWQDLEQVMDYLEEHSLWGKRFPRKCLSQLLSIIQKDKLITAYHEEEQDIDKVLNIFIRREQWWYGFKLFGSSTQHCYCSMGNS